MRDIRKHIAWYLHGFPAGADLRRALALVKTLSELDTLLGHLDADGAVPGGGRRARGDARAHRRRWRCRRDGWPIPDDCTVPAGADVMHSGG